ncbi:hypothetical protein INR77_08845 [Erythrobacter sp. SCSIO 43205]|uniref:hypothetical protein n=1 Tax=Erythrobacter sp. SCSIO 43205 TaxID=2779361 RepID=UPI001CA8F762|nr:hypothetical protein [Erythrobacter sp. SCSIO 43205]UAB76954.1 hypothetical protein INR77_08845 [Erythrobacter sp. SCSIO 43205]
MPTATKIELPALQIERLSLNLVGDSPLIVHAWSEKAKKQMLDKQMKKASKGKEAKDPEADYEACFYRTEKGAYGFPAIGVKSAMVSACRFVDMKMTEARGAFHIDCEMLEIHGEPRPREDMVRVGMGTADIRYRPEFPEWTMPVEVKFNANAVSAEQIANLLNTAGFAIGIGEWRPEKNGQYGRFHVEGSQP